MTGCKRKDFYIVSEMNEKVLDILGGNPNEGISVIANSRQGGQNQKWYLDSDFIIRSALNDMALSSKSRGAAIKTSRYKGETQQQFHFESNKIVNPKGDCIDIRGSDDNDGAEIISYKFFDTPNQKWRIEYI